MFINGQGYSVATETVFFEGGCHKNQKSDIIFGISETNIFYSSWSFFFSD